MYRRVGEGMTRLIAPVLRGGGIFVGNEECWWQEGIAYVRALYACHRPGEADEPVSTAGNPVRPKAAVQHRPRPANSGHSS